MLKRIASLLRIQPPLTVNPGLLFASGLTVNLPADGSEGYQTGCLYQCTDGGDGTALYVNEGTYTSCDFDVLGSNSISGVQTYADGSQIDLGGGVYAPLTYTADAVDIAQISAGMTLGAQSSATETDIKNLRAQIAITGANTNKHLKSIYARVDANFDHMDCYSFQGSTRVGAAPSLCAYGISQAIQLNVASIPEARVVYASFSGSGTATVSTVFMAVAGATAQKITANYEANVAAFCTSSTALKIDGEGSFDAAISLQMGSGTCGLLLTAGSETAYKDGAKTATINTGGAYPKADGVLKIHLNATDYYIPYLALANAVGA
jgi:hypothetical protein